MSEPKPRRLMEFPPDKAVVQMLNDANNTNVDPRKVVVSEPRVLTEKRTEVTLSYRRSGHLKLDPIPSVAPIDFSFNRVSVGERLAGLAAQWRPKLPCSTQDLLEYFTERTGQRFWPSDFILESITRSNSTPYTLKAHPFSLRWVGQQEFWLSDTEDLQQLFLERLNQDSNAFLTVGGLEVETQLSSPLDAFGILNATGFPGLVDSILFNELAQDNPRIVDLLNRIAGSPFYPQGTVEGEWKVVNRPESNNLYNAKVTRFVRTDNEVELCIRIDTDYCNNYTAGEFVIRSYNTETVQDVDRLVRLKHQGSSFLTNCNAYRPAIEKLSVGDLTPADIPTNGWGVDSGDIWVFVDKPAKFNLYGAKVVYNGLRRNGDPVSNNSSLTHLLLVELSDYCTNFQGFYAFFYEPTVLVGTSLPLAVRTEPYSYQLTVLGGTGPYTFTVIDTDNTFGITLDSNGLLSGISTVSGSYYIRFSVVDSAGNTSEWVVNLYVSPKGGL